MLTLQDIIFAAIIAFIATWIITKASAAFKNLMMVPTKFGFHAEDLQRILIKCHSLFPRDIMKFKGEIYKRGMTIRVKTRKSQTYEGEFMGLNDDNMICLMTTRVVIAQDIGSIEEILLLDEDAKQG